VVVVVELVVEEGAVDVVVTGMVVVGAVDVVVVTGMVVVKAVDVVVGALVVVVGVLVDVVGNVVVVAMAVLPDSRPRTRARSPAIVRNALGIIRVGLLTSLLEPT
jgi:hypothetical protein